MSDNKIYETENLPLMPYLQMCGLNYIGKRADTNGDRARIVIQFDDPRGIGPELAMSWNNSREKLYRDWWQFFRNELDKALKEVNNGKRIVD